jgi:hypothetical protein
MEERKEIMSKRKKLPRGIQKRGDSLVAVDRQTTQAENDFGAL